MDKSFFNDKSELDFEKELIERFKTPEARQEARAVIKKSDNEIKQEKILHAAAVEKIREKRPFDFVWRGQSQKPEVTKKLHTEAKKFREKVSSITTERDDRLQQIEDRQHTAARAADKGRQPVERAKAVEPNRGGPGRPGFEDALAGQKEAQERRRNALEESLKIEHGPKRAAMTAELRTITDRQEEKDGWRGIAYRLNGQAAQDTRRADQLRDGLSSIERSEGEDRGRVRAEQKAETAALIRTYGLLTVAEQGRDGQGVEDDDVARLEPAPEHEIRADVLAIEAEPEAEAERAAGISALEAEAAAREGHGRGDDPHEL